MYNEQIEQLISAALADGVLTEKEKQILFKKAQSMGIDLDEFEMVLDARLVELAKAEKAKAEASAPKSNKLGDVKKCPACGSMVQSYQGVCPECGFAFEGVDANSAVKELSNLLRKAKGHEKMEKIIDNYPIPMEKAALLSFVTWLRPQSTDSENLLANSYFKKYSECVNKIRVSFANDKELSPFIGLFINDEKAIKKQRIINLTVKNINFWVGVVILIILFFIFKPTPTNKSVQKSSIAIEKALKEGDTQKAVELFINFEGKKNNRKSQLISSGAAESIVKACLANDNFNDAKRIADNANVMFDDSVSDKAQIASLLYKYCIKNGDFENAESIYQKAYCNYCYHPEYLKDVVSYLCENNRKDEAIKFFNKHKGEINNYSGDVELVPEEVDRIIQEINQMIDSY